MGTALALPDTALVSFVPAEIPFPSKVLALFGRAAELHPLILQSLCFHTSRGEKIGVIVGDNRFDEYRLARLARAGGFDPLELLARIEFSRPFTCHQMHHCVMNLAEQPEQKWHALYILGLLETFYDEDLRVQDVKRLLGQILEQLKRLAVGSFPVLVTISPPPHETHRLGLIKQVLDTVDAYWRSPPLEIENSSQQLEMGRMNLRKK